MLTLINIPFTIKVIHSNTQYQVIIFTTSFSCQIKTCFEVGKACDDVSVVCVCGVCVCDDVSVGLCACVCVCREVAGSEECPSVCCDTASPALSVLHSA